jgi:hypothetical protein
MRFFPILITTYAIGKLSNDHMCWSCRLWVWRLLLYLISSPPPKVLIFAFKLKFWILKFGILNYFPKVHSFNYALKSEKKQWEIFYFLIFKKKNFPLNELLCLKFNVTFVIPKDFYECCICSFLDNKVLINRT